MSAIAKKMMEKYGWKEGEGLGKSREGVKTYVKVARRDAHAAIGLGHTADPAHSSNTESTHAVELDSLYGQITTNSQRHKRSRAKVAHDMEDDCRNGKENSASTSSSLLSEHRERGIKNKSRSSDEDGDSGNKNVSRRTSSLVSRNATRDCRSDDTSASSISSSSSSEDDDDDVANDARDITRMSDAELLKRCGGVRLGRAGRHRMFNGKLSRIESSHQKHTTAM